MPDKNMTVGQVVDQLADKYFAMGMDALSANMRALLDVCTAYNQLMENVPLIFDSFLNPKEESK